MTLATGHDALPAVGQGLDIFIARLQVVRRLGLLAEVFERGLAQRGLHDGVRLVGGHFSARLLWQLQPPNERRHGEALKNERD